MVAEWGAQEIGQPQAFSCCSSRLPNRLRLLGMAGRLYALQSTRLWWLNGVHKIMNEY